MGPAVNSRKYPFGSKIFLIKYFIGSQLIIKIRNYQNYNMSSVAEFESLLAFDQPIHSSIVPRWQRKSENLKAGAADRFIPNRAATDLDFSLDSAASECGNNVDEDHSKIMEEEMLGHGPARILAFKNKAPAPKDGYQSSLKVLYSQSKKTTVVKPVRHIPSCPLRAMWRPYPT